MSDLALRLARQAHETATAAADALTASIQALRAEQAARSADRETHARRMGAVEAELSRLRVELAEAVAEVERLTDALAVARSSSPAAKARTSAAAAGWSLVGDILRERRVRLAAAGLVGALLLGAAVAVWRSSGVDSQILSILLGVSHAPGPTP